MGSWNDRVRNQALGRRAEARTDLVNKLMEMEERDDSIEAIDEIADSIVDSSMDFDELAVYIDYYDLKHQRPQDYGEYYDDSSRGLMGYMEAIVRADLREYLSGEEQSIKDEREDEYVWCDNHNSWGGQWVKKDQETMTCEDCGDEQCSEHGEVRQREELPKQPILCDNCADDRRDAEAAAIENGRDLEEYPD